MVNLNDQACIKMKEPCRMIQKSIQKVCVIQI